MANAYVVDLGMTDYLETLYLQQKIARKRELNEIGDVIILTEHYPSILFGRQSEKNSFSPEFLAELSRTGRTEKEYLEGIGLRFYDNMPYGGGAAYVGPGHLVVYPINWYTRLVKPYDTEAYKDIIDTAMHKVMTDFGITDAYIAKGINPKTQRERRDVWIDKGGRSYKIASKGVYLKQNVAYHGFQLYVTKESMKHFWIVNPCGYFHDQVSVMSMEEAAKRRISMDDVKASVLSALSSDEAFGYDSIEKITSDELFGMLS